MYNLKFSQKPQIVKYYIFQETDDLDGDLFKGITKNNFSKTMPAQNKPASIMARNKSNKKI